jgi:hypothetical protein
MKEHSADSGDILSCQDGEKVASGTWWVEARDVAEHSTTQACVSY